MYRKCFFKSKGGLSRKFVASGLAAVFSAGMFGSYAGAMEPVQNLKFNSVRDEKSELANVLKEYSIKDDDENAKEVIRACISFESKFLEVFVNDILNYNKKLKDKSFLIRVYAYLSLLKFYELRDKNEFSSIDDFLKKMQDFHFQINHLSYVGFQNYDGKKLSTILLKKIEEGWGREALEKLRNEKPEQNDSENVYKEEGLSIKKEERIEELLVKNESIDKQKLDRNIKNKKTIIVVSIVSVFIILLVIFFAKKLAGKSKTNTGVPNNNKDDEKVNPSIEPEKDKDDEKMYPSTDPESDDEKVKPPIDPNHQLTRKVMTKI